MMNEMEILCTGRHFTGVTALVTKSGDDPCGHVTTLCISNYGNLTTIRKSDRKQYQ